MSISEKFRPVDWSSFVGQKHIVNILQHKTDLDHMLFVGPPGVGKTTIARLLAKQHDLPLVETNASDDRGIGMVRDIVKKHSQSGTKKIILLDESDSLTTEAQHALRGIIENTKNSIFILTGNYSYKFIEPLKSRCAIYEFKPLTDKEILSQIIKICNAESIEIEKSEETKEGIKALVKLSNGDMRKAIKTLEKILEKGKITSANVISLIRPNHAKECLELAISGNLEDAIITLENDFKERNFDTDDMLRELYECIKQQPMEYRARLFYKLSETSRSCQVTSKPILPLIHMIGFISYAFLLPHFSNKCPMLGGDS